MTHTGESFWSKVDRGSKDECWNWTGYRNSSTSRKKLAYGRIDIFGEDGVYVHRVAYFLAHPRKIELRRGKGLFVLHRCDNPVCCNPRHLFLGTNQENMRDMCRKQRSHRYVSTESPRAKLSDEDVFWIRMQKKYGATVRALALLYEVSMSTISGALYGRHYQDVV